MKKIVIVSSSPRVDGNSETLAKNFMKGAVESIYETKSNIFL